MDKQQYLVKLEQSLKKMPGTERSDMLYDFEEHFSLGREEGKTDMQIAEELGDPHKIGKELLADYRIGQAKKDQSLSNIARVLLSLIGLSLFNGLLVAVPFLTFLVVLAAVGISSIALAVSPFIFLFNLWFGEIYYIWPTFFLSICLSAIGILIGIGLIIAVKKGVPYFTRYIQFNISVVKGEKSI
ncbi:HAAS signaling domain-containing protein [Sediminibacillus massiliensis]|uniref:HAAS signaling domain-containing protein n=1 Tax=Sediminibacillus massiliensis TaxID=1926277 RepID=UPI0009888592|nr:DUF1700 domain-containing protein [Sediminibacillus massiliensis]